MPTRPARVQPRRLRWFAPLLALLLFSLVAPTAALPAQPQPRAEPQGRLVFRSIDENGQPDLFIVDLAVGLPTNLTRTPDQQEFNPDWSPDGTQVAYERRPVNNFNDTDIFTINADGLSQPVKLTTNPGLDRDPSWVESGIAFDGIAPDAKSATFEIYTIAADGTNRVNVTRNDLSDNHPSWSPDGTRVAFSRKYLAPGGEVQWDLIILNVVSGQEEYRSNTNALDECFPSWSPDNSKIVYHGGDLYACNPKTDANGNVIRSSPGDIYIIGADGSEPTQITSGPDSDVAPTWSPDMAHIAFASRRDGDRDLYVMRADGTEIRQVTNLAGDEGGPSWSPDLPLEGLLVYQGSDSGGEPDLFTLDPNGGEPINLTRTPDQREYNPDWSPNGAQIAFQRNPITNQNASDIYTMRADGRGQPARLTTNPGQDRDPSWVENGIAFDGIAADALGETYEIYLMEADGRSRRNLTASAFSDNHPSLSPNGRAVAFQRKLPRPGGGTQWDIMVLSIVTNGVGNLTNSPDTDECMPAWSPANQLIAFYKGDPGACDTSGESSVPSHIWVSDGDGRTRQLTVGPGRNIDPTWSLDGTTIAWSSNRDGDYEIYVMHESGAKLRQLTFNTTPDMAPDWRLYVENYPVYLPFIVKP